MWNLRQLQQQASHGACMAAHSLQISQRQAKRVQSPASQVLHCSVNTLQAELSFGVSCRRSSQARGDAQFLLHGGVHTK